MWWVMLIGAVLGADGGTVDAGVDAGVDLFEPVITAQAARFEHCRTWVDGGTAHVAVEFQVTDAGVQSIRTLEESPLTQCVSLATASLEFPPAVRGFRVETVSVEGDGGVKTSRFTSGGGLKKDVIHAVIKSHVDAIRRCYEISLQRDPELKGKVLVEWVIGTGGNVVEAKVASQTLSDPAVGECVLKEVRGWEFPRPFGGGIVNVTFPYIFIPKGDEAD